ncbi:MAG: hypothetical protein LC659_05550 [Myxococcales bacterium]|nr:hypothetical protein [Myxococcales bacterium]
MRPLLAVVALAAGCSVDVGAGSIDPVVVDAPINAAADSPPLSLTTELDFLTPDQAASIDNQYGAKLGAVSAIDVRVTALDIVDDASGTTVAGGSVDLTLPGVSVDAIGQRVRLPDAQKRALLAAIKAHAALTVPVTAILSWPEPAPTAMTAHSVLQPIIVVDALSAL